MAEAIELDMTTIIRHSKHVVDKFLQIVAGKEFKPALLNHIVYNSCTVKKR